MHKTKLHPGAKFILMYVLLINRKQQKATLIALKQEKYRILSNQELIMQTKYVLNKLKSLFFDELNDETTLI